MLVTFNWVDEIDAITANYSGLSLTEGSSGQYSNVSIINATGSTRDLAQANSVCVGDISGSSGHAKLYYYTRGDISALTSLTASLGTDNKITIQATKNSEADLFLAIELSLSLGEPYNNVYTAALDLTGTTGSTAVSIALSSNSLSVVPLNCGNNLQLTINSSYSLHITDNGKVYSNVSILGAVVENIEECTNAVNIGDISGTDNHLKAFYRIIGGKGSLSSLVCELQDNNIILLKAGKNASGEVNLGIVLFLADEQSGTITHTNLFLDGKDGSSEVDISCLGLNIPCFNSASFTTGECATINLCNPLIRFAPEAAHTINVTLFSGTDPTGITVVLEESAFNSGIFSGTVHLVSTDSNQTNQELKVSPGDMITVIYNSTITTALIYAAEPVAATGLTIISTAVNVPYGNTGLTVTPIPDEANKRSTRTSGLVRCVYPMWERFSVGQICPPTV
jgi:hypothetical protein